MGPLILGRARGSRLFVLIPMHALFAAGAAAGRRGCRPRSVTVVRARLATWNRSGERRQAGAWEPQKNR